MNGGAKIWYFPDGYLPEKTSNGGMEAHEALMLFNTAGSDASVSLDIYFSKGEPVRNIGCLVKKETVKVLRLDNPEDIGGTVIPPLTQYALRIRSDVPLVAQFGRLDTTQTNMAYYGSMGYCED